VKKVNESDEVKIKEMKEDFFFSLGLAAFFNFFCVYVYSNILMF
jgi:hypothetical protein